MPRGGHFANETDPQLVIDDLHRFFGGLQGQAAGERTDPR
jgi:hypothetical protein